MPTGWERAFRALLDGRKVHESGDVTFQDLNGDELDLERAFTIDDDSEEMAHFLREAGFLHLTGVFDPNEMDAVGADIDEWIAMNGSRRLTPMTANPGGPRTKTGSSGPAGSVLLGEVGRAARSGGG